MTRPLPFIGGKKPWFSDPCATGSDWRHPRSYERDDKFDPLCYLALIEQKINALNRGHPMGGWRLPEELNVSLASGPANGRSAKPTSEVYG